MKNSGPVPPCGPVPFAVTLVTLRMYDSSGYPDVRSCKMRMLLWRLKTLVNGLGSGPRFVGQLGPGVQVTAIFTLRM